MSARDDRVKICPLCLGEAAPLYRMGAYTVMQCRGCKSGFADPMPDSSALEAFYQGFHPNLKAEAVMGRLDLAGALFGYLGMKPDGSRTFLDVGGGNGLFAKAFEVLGYGTSTYVDIDEVACRFVRNDLGIRSVRVCDVRELDVGYAEAFDLIYSRHLVEHLTDPLGFITKLASFRKPGGMLVVQCPNGDSLEYLPYFYSNVRDRFRKIRQATGWSKGRLLRCWLGGGMLHGIDPPRHLWAFSQNGMRKWAAREGLPIRIFTRNLAYLPFSPGYFRRANRKERTCDFIGRHLFARLRGGTHLILMFQEPHEN